MTNDEARKPGRVSRLRRELGWKGAADAARRRRKAAAPADRELSRFELMLVEEFDFSPPQAREKAPAAHAAISALRGMPTNPATTEDDPRFAHLDKYAVRRRGEDAIAFYKRVWAEAPAPFYRDHVVLHDPALIAAVTKRCSNLNAGLGPGEKRHHPDQILPPWRPLEAAEERRRANARARQARYRAKKRQGDEV